MSVDVCYCFVFLSVVCCSYVLLNLAFAMPQTLIPYLTHVLDFLFAIIEILMELVCVLLLYASNVFGFIVKHLYKISPYIFNVCSGLFSFGFWIVTQIIHGVFGNGDFDTNILSWVFILSAGFLYFDTVYRNRKERIQNNEGNRDNNAAVHILPGLQYNQEDNIRHFLIQPEELYSEDDTDSNSIYSDYENDQELLENEENENEANIPHEANHLNIRTAVNTNANAGRIQLPSSQHQEDRTLCSICFERERNIAVFPCGHIHMCLECVQIVEQGNNLCPVCQSEIEEYKQVFF